MSTEVHVRGAHAAVIAPGLSDEVAVEEPLEIRVDGRPLAVTMRTPGHDEELALGFLLRRGPDRRPRARRVPRPTSPANTVEVAGPLLREPDARSFYTTSSCGVCGKGALEEVAVYGPAPGGRRPAPVARARSPTCPSACASRPSRARAACTPPACSRRAASSSASARTSAATTRWTRSSGGHCSTAAPVPGLRPVRERPAVLRARAEGGGRRRPRPRRRRRADVARGPRSPTIATSRSPASPAGGRVNVYTGVAPHRMSRPKTFASAPRPPRRRPRRRLGHGPGRRLAPHEEGRLAHRRAQGDRVACARTAPSAAARSSTPAAASSSTSRATRNSPVNQGTLCPKGSASRQLVQQPGRLTKVSYRRPGGTEWEELDLETAMDMIADRVVAARENGWQDVNAAGLEGRPHARLRPPRRRDARQRGELPDQEGLHRDGRGADREPGPHMTLLHGPRSGDLVRARRRHR